MSSTSILRTYAAAAASSADEARLQALVSLWSLIGAGFWAIVFIANVVQLVRDATPVLGLWPVIALGVQAVIAVLLSIGGLALRRR